MTRARALSPIARSVLAVLDEAGGDWSHGYDLCRRTGVRSGTLYPLLIRLEAQGFLEATWLEAVSGRPPRHAYRLTSPGRALTRANPPIPAPDPQPRARPA
ncbi:MAG: PadR family transcriptional regulator [Brevundimonas sp.]|uniref:PadR family transcriptional regulator n=1 Tax=Brevundimonas sp. TaxID=1871086 RepID=UPI0040343EE2